MFSKGDKVVYPLYGAGIIEDMEVQKIDGEKRVYYSMFIPVTNLRIMISEAKVETLGIRQVYQHEEILEIIKNADCNEVDSSETWNQRYQLNLSKIKSGQLTEVASVFKSLLEREREKSLSSAEKKMLTSAKQIILSEIVLSQDIEKKDAEALLLSSTM